MIKREELKCGDIVDFETILYRVLACCDTHVIVEAVNHPDWELETAQYSELYWPNDWMRESDDSDK